MKYIDNIIFSTLGYFYYTIVFVGILKGHRGLPSRSSLDDSETNPISRYEIVGAGEIVANRLLPALISQGIHQSCITIRDFEIDKKLECSDDADRIYSIHARIRKKYKLVVYKSMNEMKNSFWNISNPVFICCTQSSHWRILRQIHACSPSVPIALEKPAFLPDQINDELRSYPNFDKVFFLSYYTLEKALPLTFLFLEQKNFTFATPYGQLLSGFIGDKNSNLYSTTDVAKFIRKIALFSEDEPNITNIEITILENEDRRLWANNSVYGEGGFLLETFLHALLLLRRISPRYLKFEKGESNSGQLNLGVYRPKNYPYSDCNQCSLKEFSNGATINIKVGKYLDSDVCKKIINQSSQGNSSRYCKIQFRNNTYISIDFNTSSLKFYDGHDKELASLNLISNDIEKNNIKYNVQVKLFQSFCNSGASWNQLKSQGMERYDEMDGQMQLIPLIGDVMRRAGLGAIRGDNWQEKYGARVIPIQILKDEAEVCNFYSQDAC